MIDFDGMLTEASVWGAQLTAALDHHVSNYECGDCGVGWILEGTGALTQKKISSGHLILSSNHGLRTTELPRHL